MKWVRVTKMACLSRGLPQIDLKVGRMPRPQRSSPRSKERELHTSLNILQQEEEPPESETLKAIGAYIWKK